MKVSRSVCLVFLFLAAILFQTDRFMAHAATVPPGACLYALDPTADRAFQIAGAQSVYTACGVVSESSASDGFEMEGSETLYLQNHAQVSVVGGAQLNGQTYLLDTISNKQVQAVKTTSPGDPLASITAPTTGTIVSKSHAYYDMNAKPTNNTLSPGVYCGGLTIGNTNGTAFTLSPGTYIMAGGGLVLNSQAVVNGTGVTVYNTSSAGWGCSSSYNYTPITISGQVTANLSAPTTGALEGILFFGNRTGCSTAGACVDQINGGSTAVLNGALYFKSDEIEITGSNASGYVMLVADKIYINGNSTLGNNGNPFNGITVSVSPSATTLFSGQTQQFTATVNNSANSAVSWTISPAGVGSISSSGLYTAPPSVTALQTVTITATSQADTSKSATATVTLEVTKATPTITWATPGAITYGTALSSTQLDATASVAGTFVYTPAAGSVLAAGTQALSVTFTPTNTTSYNTATATVTLAVNKATPAITWATPAAITYGTALSTTQLDATASVAGMFAYTPSSGTVLSAGSQTLSVTFTPTVTADYSTATAVVPLTVNQASQTISFTAASPVTYGVSSISLSATASSGLPVTFSVTSGSGSISGSTLTITGAGTVVVAANQAGNASYSAAAQVTQSIVVTQAVLTVTAGNASRAYGAANPSFTDTMTGFVNGDTSSVVSGSPSLTTTATSTSAVGTYPINAAAGTLSAANYSFAFVAGTLTVTQASTTVACSPVAITYGTPLSLTQLNCTSGGVTGNFVLTPTLGTVLPAGTQSISAAFTPTDTADYSTATTTATLTVNQATPVITWATPTAVPSGTALSAAQLDATANVPGSFVYTPVSGTILAAGTQTLSATFTPTDATDYSTAAATVVLTVNNLPVSVTVSPTTASLNAGQTQQFTATVSNTSNTTVMWSISPVGAGSISATGLYTAPVTIPTQQTVTVTATSQADTTQSATTNVTLTPSQCTSNGYSYQRAIVISHMLVPNTDQINFPFLFNTTDPLLATTANNGHVTSPNGYDIFFTSDPAGQNALNYEMEKYNPATGQVIAWVQIPTLSHTSDTVIYLFYGNPNVTTSQQNATGVWDSYYEAVYHLANVGSGNAVDSTTNGNNGTASGATQAQGEIDGAASFNGTSSLVTAPNSSSLDVTSAVTLCAWIDPASISSGQRIVSKGNTGDSNSSYYLYLDSSSNLHMAVNNTGWNDVGYALKSANSWYYACGTFDGNNRNLYVNGQLQYSIAQSATISISNAPFYIGGQYSDTQFFDGIIDEVSVSSVARSADWIASEYLNQSSPASFYELYSENAGGIVPATVNLSSSQSQQFVAVDTCDSPVTWSMTPNSQGTLTAGGFYTAPATIATQQTVMISAASQASGATFGSATVTLMSQPPLILPAGGPAGTVITINGVGFGTAEGPSSVTVGGLPAMTLSWSDTQIQAQIPTGTGLGAQNVVVTVGGQVIADVTFTVTSGMVGVATSPSGTWASLTIDTPGQNAMLLINGTAGQQINAWVINADFPDCYAGSIRILNPSGSTLASSGFCKNGGVSFVTLPTTGIYTILVAPNSGLTGSATVVVSGEQTGTITLGVPVPVTISAPGQNTELTFSGTAGEQVNAWVVSATFPDCYAGSISILNPNGSTLASGGFCQNGGVSFVTLPVTGTYTVVLAPNNGLTGSATVVVSGEQTGTITLGVPVPVTISTPGQNTELTFSGTAGEQVNAWAINATFPDCYAGSISILNPNGSTLASSGFCQNGGVSFVTLPVTGTYTVVLAPNNGLTGSATVVVSGEQTGTITPGVPKQVTINTPGQGALLTFLGGAGQAESVQVSNSTYPGCYGLSVSILNPNGSTLTSYGTCPGDTTIPFVTLPVAGIYTMVVNPGSGGTGTGTILLVLNSPKVVTVNASLAPVESYFGSTVSVNLALTASSGAVPTGTVSCTGAGVTSAPVTVNAIGGATVLMNGLPLGKDAIVCSFASNSISTFLNAVSSTVTESVIAVPSTGTVSVTPASAALYGGQVQQFSASVFNTSNQAVTWTISPSGTGTISATGFYTAPTRVASLQTVTITATSQANTSQSASAMITLSPAQCASSGYSYQRSIVIDHTKVPNADQADFPFLFDTTDPSLATTANGGHVSSSSGYDIFFSTDPAGLTKLDHELEQYNPATGQVIAWVRVPTLSHTSDTVLYVFYGNSSVTTSQQNPNGVWDSNYAAVYHLANVGTTVAADSTANGNTATLSSVATASGEIGGAGSFNGVSSYMQIPSADFLSYPTSGSTTTGFSTSFGIWFKTASAGVILGQTDGTMPGGSPGTWQPALYLDTAGLLRASIFSHGSTASQIVTAMAYNDNNWHFAVDTYTNGTEELYVDGQFAGSQQVAELGYNPVYSYFLGTGETANWSAANGSWLNFNGGLEEVKVSNIARSGDWVQAEYANQSSSSTFYALHPENAVEVVPATVSLYASQGQPFTVLGSVAGSCNYPSILWSMPSGVQGTLTASGIYTAPNSITSQQTVPITATTLGDSTESISAVVTLLPPVTVSLTPGAMVLSAGQTQQFTASVNNASNTAVTWTINPTGDGLINTSGLYTAPTSVTTQQTINVTATSQVDPTQSASGTITLSPTSISPISPPPTQCASSGYGYQRVVVIDHTRVSNTDQTNFPFLFNTTDPSLATIANGGQVTSSNGYDIIFSTDPNGLTKLDHELEEYDPVHGQVIAWVRIPKLSHTTDTVLYVFYGNPNVVGSQQNPTGVWDSNYTAVYHLANAGSPTVLDSTANANTATPASVLATSGQIDGAASFNGASSYIQIPEADFPNFPPGVYDNVGLPSTTSSFSSSFGVWFKTASAGGILNQSTSLTCTWNFFGCISTGPIAPGDSPYGSWDSLMYVDDNGSVNGFGLVSPAAYNDNNWHFAVVTYANNAGNGTSTLYVDGKSVASAQGTTDGYDSNYAYFVGTAYTFEFSEGNWGWQYFNGDIDEVTVSSIPRSADWIQTEYNNQGSPSTFYTFNPANTVQVVPSAINLYAAQSQQFAATVACNTSVLWTMSSGAQGTLTSSGLYTAPGSIATQQTVTITATNQISGSTIGSAVVSLLPPPSPITLVASAQSPYATGSSQPFSATLLDQNGAPRSGVAVTFTVAGANSSIGSGVTGSNGVASYAYTGANTGNDTIRATAVVNGQAVTSNSVSASWIVPAPAIPAAGVTLIAPPALGAIGLVGAFTDKNGAVIEPIAIGASPREYVVPVGATQLQLGVDSAYFVTDGGPGFAVAVNGVSVSVPPTAMPWIWTIGGLNNNYQYGIYNPSIQSGILDGTNPIVAATGLAQGESVTIAYQSGTASANYPLRALVNADGDQTSITGVQVWQGTYFPTLYTTTSSYPVGQPITFNALVTDATGAPLPNAPVTLNITGANAQQLQATTDSAGTATFMYIGSNPGTDSLQALSSSGASLVSSQSSVTWVNYANPPAAGTLNLQLLAHVADAQGYEVLATDASGNPVFDANIGFYVWGIDNFQLSGRTDVTGHVMFTYNHVNPGTYNIVAVEPTNRNIVFSNPILNAQWTGPSASTPTGNTITINISGNTSVTMPNTLQLNGTVSDSTGLPTSLTWSKVSGPGTVTFANPNQTVTTAAFGDVGSYVLQLSASDATGNSGSVQWPVTVYPPNQDPQGWVASPAYGSTVTGIVPITLAPGVSLQSGILVYYPATNANSVTVLNANTTGSGQIGTLDTTVLANGTYWIQLQATDTNGETQYSLVLVTVAGNYKPGRVTATVTDLVVPATGLAINIQRTYDSLNAATSGDFGYGWNLGINTNLTVDPAGNVTFTLGGQRKTFYLTPQSLGWLYPWYSAAFTPEPGFFGTLTDSGTGCADFLDFLVPGGGTWFCLDGGQFNPPGYIYTDPNGTSYTISSAGNLQSIQDRSGNGLTITANGITSSTGLSVPFVRDSSNRITRITDPQGNIYRYGYDANGNLATVTYPNTTTPSTYTYDANHLYLSGADARSNPLPVTAYYDSANDGGKSALDGRLLSVTDSFNNTTSYAYNLATNTTTVTYPPDASGNVGTATMVYDSYGKLLSSTDPLNNTTTNVYDANHNLISTTDPLGHTTTSTYDNNGNKTSSTYPATATSKNTTSYTVYNQYSEPTQTTDELGNVRAFNYDANYNPQSVTDSAGTLASFNFNANTTLAAGAIGFDISVNPGMASQFTYDANGNMVSRTDALGRTTTYTYNSLGQKTAMVAPTPTTLAGGSASTTLYQYDALGNLIQTAAPLSRTTGSTYDANGNKISSTDARGNVTTYQYDPLNRLIETDYPSNSTTPATKSTRTYDFRNNVIKATDQNGNVTLNAYDLAGRLISVTRGYGTSSAGTTTYGYDNAGRKISETDALNHTTSYTYDAGSRLIAVSGVAGNFQYTYDDAGNQVARTDGNNNTTQFQYDARKRLIKTAYPDGTSVTNSYDGPGNLASVTDQASNVVQYTYDAANQLKTVTQLSHPDPSRNTNSYGYDNLGNLSGLTDENLHTTQNWFDLFNEPVQKTLPDGSLTETRSYDQAGNLVSLTHFNGVTTTYTYDALNRLLTRSTPGEPTVSFTYTATGKYLTSTAGDGTVNYSYDSLDRLTTKATPEGALSYTYYASGNVESITSSNPNGVSVTLTWDELNRLSTVIDNRLPSGANTAVYTYDPAGNVATATYPNGFQTTFTYDQLSRLTAMSTPVSSYNYQLGATGNRVSATEGNGRALTWNYDGIYRLTNETISNDPSKNDGSVSYGLDPVGNRLSANSTLPGINPIAGTYNADDQISSETYDANGNVTATEGITYTYDSQNHMTSETGNGKVITMVYDAFGNRVSKTVNGVTTRYLIEDDVNPTGLPQVLEEVQNGAAVRTYTYGLQRISESQFIGNVWTTSFYGYDGAGSVRQLTNSAGAVTDEYEYDAYGNSFTKQGTTPNNYLYRGEQFDADLGLYYLRARYYNPATGRFASRDPKEHTPYEFGRKPLNPARLHKYLYAGGDPVNRIDPMGREDEEEYGAITERDLTQSARFVAQTQKLTRDAVQAAIEALKQANGGSFAGNPDIWINAVTMDVYLEEADAFEYLDNLSFYL
jgi:RHS repeat-associated protein